MKKQISIAEAKAQLSGCIRQVENGDSMLLTRHGKAVAALVPASALEQLERLRQAGPAGGLASLAGGWPDSAELAELLDTSTRSAPRSTDRPD